MTINRQEKIKISVVAVLLAAAFFIAYSFLPLFAPVRDNSPDENSNRYFSSIFAETGQLWTIEPLDFLAPDIIHPRSVRIQDGLLVPGGFLGLPMVYGGLAGVLGIWILPFLTALFALIGVIGFGLVVSHLFGKRFGAIAAFLLAVQPDWWYQSSRPFMPNVLFLSFVLLAAGLFWTKPISKRFKNQGNAFLAGIALGVALAVRPPEAYWLFLVILILIAAFGIRKYWQRLLSAAIGLVIGILPFALMNRVVYGGWLASGYGSGIDVPVSSLSGGFGAKLIGPLQPYLFPLGFAPRSAIIHFWNFGVGLFSWWWLLVLAALVWFAIVFWSKRNKNTKVAQIAKSLIAVSLVTALWLILFYGSWIVRDNPDPGAVTLGSSYLRYWLPIFVFSVLPVAWVLDRVWQGAKHGKKIALAVLALITLASGITVFMSPQEGLLMVRENLYKSDKIAERILELTEPESLIVADRGDKFIFPDRPVINPLRSEATWKGLGLLAPRLEKIYYFGITFPDSDMEWLNSVKLPPIDLQIRLVESFDDESLYIFEYQE